MSYSAISLRGYTLKIISTLLCLQLLLPTVLYAQVAQQKKPSLWERTKKSCADGWEEHKETVYKITIGVVVAAAAVMAGKMAIDSATDNSTTTIADRKPINYRYAGDPHPSGVPFTKQGYPDFSDYSKAQVRLNRLTGDYYQDSFRANRAVGLDKTPLGHTWHHVEDGKTLQLVPRSIHSEVRHTGGSSIIKSQSK